MSSTNLKIVIAMARSYNALFSQIEKNVQEFGLNLSEFGVLEFLWHKGEQPIQKVAEKILVTSGTITYIIDKLQKNGLVERKKCEKDKRVYYVGLTPEGKQRIAEIFPRHQEFLDNLLSKMEEDSKKALLDSLIKLKDALNERTT